MAASMINRFRSTKTLTYSRLRCLFGVSQRTILTDQYRCDQHWNERLKNPLLSQINPSNFTIDMLIKFTETRILSKVDVKIFANLLGQFEKEDLGKAKDILLRYRHNDISCPIDDSVNHAVIRGYIENGNTEELLEMIKDKHRFGIFPDPQACCLLLDHLLDRELYGDAAKVAYEVVLQEDFDHPLCNLLCLYACVKHYYNTMDFTPPQPTTVDPDEEIEYIPVKYLHNPHYDDHFDIKDERFLLGKSLYQLGKHIDGLQPDFQRSLQLIGLGLYEKFELANQKLEDWLSDKDIGGTIVYKEVLLKYEEQLNNAPERDPEAPEKEMGDKTIDDEIELLKLTPMEKMSCIAALSNLVKSVMERTNDSYIQQYIDSVIWTHKTQYESADITIMKKNYKLWEKQRELEVAEQQRKYEEETKLAEIQEKLWALQKREELLTYFENEVDISLHQLKGSKKKKEESKVEVEEEVEEAEYVDLDADVGKKTVVKKK